MTRLSSYQPPFPWFGGKSLVADRIWAALGEVENYVEPFCGSCAVLMLRPGGAGHVETIKCGLMRAKWSNCYASDIRLKSPACRHFEERLTPAAVAGEES